MKKTILKIYQKILITMGIVCLLLSGLQAVPLTSVSAASTISIQDLYQDMDSALKQLFDQGFTYSSAGSCTGILARVLMYVDYQNGTDFSRIQYFTSNPDNSKWNGTGLGYTKYSGSQVANGLESYGAREIGNGYSSDAELNASDAMSGDIFTMEDVNGGRRSGASGHCGFIYRDANGQVYTRSISTGYGVNPVLFSQYYGSKGSKIHIYRIGTTDKTISIQLHKTSSNPNISVGDSYSLEGAIYGIYEDETCLKQLDTITTDASGNGSYTTSTPINTNALYVKEISPSKGFELDSTVYKAAFEGTVSCETTLNVKEQPKYDTVGIKIIKKNQDAQVTNPHSLENAQFRIQYYATLEDITNKESDATWYILTKKVNNEYVALLNDPSFLDHSVQNSNYYYDESGNIVLPIGTITIEETRAPEGYNLCNTFTVTDSNGSQSEVSINPNQSTKITSIYSASANNGNGGYAVKGIQGNVFTVTDDEIRPSSLTIQKLDTETLNQPQGDAPNLETTLRIKNENEFSASITDLNGNVFVANAQDYFNYVIKTDANGYWSSKDYFERFIPYGKYTIEESQAPVGYLLEGTTSHSVMITNADQDAIIHLTKQEKVDNAYYDQVIRGGFSFQKYNSEMLNAGYGTSSEGDGGSKISFDLYNRSEHPVFVNGQLYAKDALILSDATNESGYYASRNNLLPYGTYEIVETNEPVGYQNNQKKSVKFSIRNNLEIVNLQTAMTNTDVIRAGFEIQKYGTDLGSKLEGNASLQMTCQIINKSLYPVIVNGKGYGKDEAVFEFTTNESGYYKSPIDLLPYGTYEVVESSAPNGYFNNENARQELIIREHEKVYDLVTDKVFTNTIYRGGFELQKLDSETNTRVQGDGNLQIEFDIVNRSERVSQEDGKTYQQPVKVNGEVYEYGQVVFSDTTDEDGYYKSASNVLPYGTYQLVETKKPLGYTSEGTTQTTFTISEDGQIISILDTIQNRPVLSYWTLEKCLTDDKYNNESDWTKPETGAKFTAILKNKITDTNKDGTISYDEFMNFFHTLDQDKDFMLNDEEALTKDITKREYASIVTDETGKASTQNHMNTYGTYVIAQTYSANEEITVAKETQEFKIEEENDITNSNEPAIQFHVNNRPKSYYLQIEKVDAQTNQTVTLNSASFKIYQLTNQAGEEVNQYVSQKVGFNHYDTFKTTSINEDTRIKQPLEQVKEFLTRENQGVYYSQHSNEQPYGVVCTPLKLLPGRYRIDEVETADGFTILKQGKEIQIGSSYSNVDDDQDEFVRTTILNERINGTLEIQKEIEDFKADTSLIDRNDFSQIQFELRANQDILNPDDGSIFVEKEERALDINGNDVSLISLDENGYAKILNLPLGQYKLCEIAAADGILKDSTEHIFELKQNEDDTETETYEVKFTDEKIKTNNVTQYEPILNHTTKVQISKTDITGQQEVEGATLQILDSKEEVVDEWISTNKPHMIEGLVPLETYTLVETIAPNGYVQANSISFTVKEDSTVQRVSMVDTQVTVTKKDEEGNVLKDAVLSIVDEEGKTIDSWMSEEEHIVSNLQEGKNYVLTETKPKDGYYYAKDITFKPSTSENLNLEMIDNKIQYQIIKVDEKGNPVAGVTLQLQDVTDGENPIDISLPNEGITTTEPFVLDGVLIAEHHYVLTESEYVAGVYKATDIEFTVPKYGSSEPLTITMVDETTNISVIKVDDLGNPIQDALLQVLDQEENVVAEIKTNGTIHGTDISTFVKGNETYILREVEAPLGYEKAEDIIFTVTGTSEHPQVLQMVDARLVEEVHISKVDATDGKELEGASLEIVNDQNEVVDSWVSNGYEHIVKLEIGKTYTLIETIAPDGYETASKITFTVNGDHEVKQVVKMLDERKIVETGDSSSLIIYIGITACALLLATVLIKFKQKRKNA